LILSDQSKLRRWQGQRGKHKYVPWLLPTATKRTPTAKHHHQLYNVYKSKTMQKPMIALKSTQAICLQAGLAQKAQADLIQKTCQ